MSKSLAKNSAFYMIYNIVNMVFSFMTGIYAARVLLPSDVGLVEYARNIAQYFVILAFLGIPTYGLREISKARDDKNRLNRLYSELFIINFVSTILFLLVYLFLIFFYPDFRKDLSVYLIYALSIVLNIINIDWLFSGLEEFKFISLRNALFKVLTFLILIAFVHSSEDYLIYAFTTVVGISGNNIYNIIYARHFVHFTLDGLEFRKHLKPIFLLVMVNIAIEIHMLIDITMLGSMCSKEEVAFYSYARKIQLILLGVFTTFTTVVVPRLAYLYGQKQKDEFNKILGNTLLIILLLSIPSIVGIYFVADYAITAVYTTTYASSATILKILSWLLLIYNVGYLLGSRVLLIVGKESKMALCVGIGAIAHVLLNMWFIPNMQGNGAAIATVLSESVITIVYVYLGWNYFSLKGITKDVAKICMATFVMGLALFSLTQLPINSLSIFVLQIGFGILIFIGMLLIMEESMIGHVLNKIKLKFIH